MAFGLGKVVKSGSTPNFTYTCPPLNATADGITLPAATVEKLLPSASLTLTINSVDYVTNKNIVSLDLGWKNNIHLDAGSFPAPASRARAMPPRERFAGARSAATARRA